MHKPQQHDDTQSVELGYELTDVQVKIIFVMGIVFTVVCIIGFIVGVFFVKYFEYSRPAATKFVPHPLAAQEQQWNAPFRLQANLFGEFKTLNESQTAKLGQYDVISEDPAIYQVPVEKAIEWVAADGLPNFSSLPTVQAAQQEAETTAP